MSPSGAPTRERAIDAVKVGDVIFAAGAGDQEKLLLVYKVDQSGIFARSVATQTNLKFGRDGKTRSAPAVKASLSPPRPRCQLRTMTLS
jgi:hypothetical protein